MISQRHLFLQHVAQTSASPMMIEVDRAEGCHIFDPHGKKYLDFISGISVSNVGHRHPAVTKAIHEQVDRFMHVMVYGEYIYSPQVRLSTRLCEILGPGFDNVYLVNSGSEAIEGAIKLAKKYTRRPNLISCHNAYHGSTHGALTLLGDEYFKQNYRPLLPGHRLIRFNNHDDLKHIDEQTAAVVMEVVQAEAGILLPEKGYLQAVRDRCNQTGTLLVFDEIQTGFGRTGSWMAFHQAGVVPDIVTLAKGMGGGLPIGAFVSRKEIMNCLMDNPILGHITTFGGNPVCSAAALGVIQAIEEDQLLEQIPAKSKLLQEQIQSLGLPSSGTGLMYSVDLGTTENVLAVCDLAKSRGLIVDWFLFAPNKIRLAPPLVISPGEILEGMGILSSCIRDVMS